MSTVRDVERASPAALLPARIEGDGLVLRRWRPDDAAIQHRAIVESIEHLRPGMAWIADEPLPLERRRRMLREWERDWMRGGSVYLGVFSQDDVAGSTGLHRRRGAGVLEIGYWIHPRFVRRGFATAVARLLTDTAFGVAGVEQVEIRHDKANVASAGVPRRLGYDLVGQAPATAAAPAAVGIDCVWRVTRDDWTTRPRDDFSRSAPS